MNPTFLFYLALLVTIFLSIGLCLDILCKVFGHKVPVQKLQLTYYSNYSQVGDVYHIQGEYQFEWNGKVYSAKRMNYLSLAAGALSQKNVETHIEKVKNRGYAYVFTPYPKINCLMPFYYSGMFLAAMILFGPLALCVL